MDEGQFTILRFAKYKDPEIGNIVANNERTKEHYTSNPYADMTRIKAEQYILQSIMDTIPPEIIFRYAVKAVDRERGDAHEM